MTTKPTYYIKIGTFGENKKFFVGPFESYDDAATEWARALSAPGSKVQSLAQLPFDVKDGVRVWDIYDHTQVLWEGLHLPGDDDVNLIGQSIPLCRAELEAAAADPECLKITPEEAMRALLE